MPADPVAISWFCLDCGLETVSNHVYRKPKRCEPCGKIQSERVKWTAMGVNYDDVIAARERAGDACEICFADFQTPVVDHCHATNKVRGLLCTPCNTALGMMRDDTKRLRSAAEYLERSRSHMDKPEPLPVVMRVPMTERTYRVLKAAAALRGVGQGELLRQILEENLPNYMNFGTVEESEGWMRLAGDKLLNPPTPLIMGDPTEF